MNPAAVLVTCGDEGAPGSHSAPGFKFFSSAHSDQAADIKPVNLKEEDELDEEDELEDEEPAASTSRLPTAALLRRFDGASGEPKGPAGPGRCTECGEVQDVYSFSSRYWYKQCHRHGSLRPAVIGLETFYDVLRGALTVYRNSDQSEAAQIAIEL